MGKKEDFDFDFDVYCSLENLSRIHIPNVVNAFTVALNHYANQEYLECDRKKYEISTLSNSLLYVLECMINKSTNEVLDKIDKHNEIKEKEKEWKSQTLNP